MVAHVLGPRIAATVTEKTGHRIFAADFQWFTNNVGGFFLCQHAGLLLIERINVATNIPH
jgi:hypothetical protein